MVSKFEKPIKMEELIVDDIPIFKKGSQKCLLFAVFEFEKILGNLSFKKNFGAAILKILKCARVANKCKPNTTSEYTMWSC